MGWVTTWFNLESIIILMNLFGILCWPFSTQQLVSHAGIENSNHHRKFIIEKKKLEFGSKCGATFTKTPEDCNADGMSAFQWNQSCKEGLKEHLQLSFIHWEKEKCWKHKRSDFCKDGMGNSCLHFCLVQEITTTQSEVSFEVGVTPFLIECHRWISKSFIISDYQPCWGKAMRIFG